MAAPAPSPSKLIQVFTVERPAGGFILIGVESDGTTWMRTLAIQAASQTYVISSPWEQIPIGSL